MSPHGNECTPETLSSGCAVATDVSGDAGPPLELRTGLCGTGTDGETAEATGELPGASKPVVSPRRATAAELEKLAWWIHYYAVDENVADMGGFPAHCVATRVLSELATLRAEAGTYEPPSRWKLVDAPTKDAWLAARATRLTASDVPAVFGASKWKRRPAVVKDKASPPARPWNGNFATRGGGFLEDGVLRWFGHEAGLTVVQLRHPNGTSMLFDHPYIEGLAASPDGVVLDHDGIPVAVVECKVTKGKVVDYDMRSAAMQAQTQAACLDLPGCWVVVCAGTDMRFTYFPADMAWRAKLPATVNLFWQSVVALIEATVSVSVEKTEE